jgi:hypothetical protein
MSKCSESPGEAGVKPKPLIKIKLKWRTHSNLIEIIVHPKQNQIAKMLHQLVVIFQNYSIFTGLCDRLSEHQTQEHGSYI